MKKNIVNKVFLILSLCISSVNTTQYSSEEIASFINAIKNNEVRNFLALIAKAESTKKKDLTNKAFQSEYSTLFSNKQIESFNDHPNIIKKVKVKTAKGNFITLSSTAYGRYQILYKTFKWLNTCIENLYQESEYDPIRSELHIIYKNREKLYENGKKIYKKKKDLLNKKNGPFLQDFLTIVLLSQAGVLDSIKEPIREKDELEEISCMIAKTWASFPTENGKSHYQNQQAHPVARLWNWIKEIRQNSTVGEV